MNVPKDHDDLSLPADLAAPTAADFDRAFSAAAASPGVRRVWELAAPELPPQIEPFSFVSAGLLRHVAQALDLSPGQALVDLGCGRGGPGLWLARETDASLIGVDFSPVAIDQAAHRAALFGLAGRARFAVGDLTRTGLPPASADAAVSIDAFHFAADPAAAAGEARRILRPGRRLVLTNWQPKDPNDARLPAQDAYRLATATAQRGLRRYRDWRPGPSGTTCGPASTGSPWTSVIPAATCCSPTCKTKPGTVSRQQTSSTGSPSPRPLPVGSVKIRNLRVAHPGHHVQSSSCA
jgi:SAM-dependent methyltransferase